MQFSRLRYTRSEAFPWVVLTAIALLIAAVLVGLPGVRLFQASITGGAGPSFDNYIDAYTNPQLLAPLVNTLKVGIMVTIGGLLIGLPMAWLVSRTDLPGRRVFRYISYGSFIVPPWLGAVAWVLLASPRTGLLNLMTDWLFGIKPFDIYSLGGLAFVMTLYLYPFTFVLATNALDNVGGDLEEAAAIAGASAWRRARTITIPLAMPAVANAMILTFLTSAALFGPPAIIAIPARQHVFTTQLYQLFKFLPPQLEIAAAYGMPIVLLAFAFGWLRKKVLGRRGYSVIGGSSQAAYRLPLKRWRWPAFMLLSGFVVLAVVLPILTLLYTSLLEAWTQPSLDFTSDNYTTIWESPRLRRAISNTLRFGVIGASGCVVIASLFAYLHNRRSNAVTSGLVGTITAPVVVPGLLLGIAYFAAFSRPPLFLYGTAAAVIAVLWGRISAFAVQILDPGIRAISVELEQASRTVGVGLIRTIRRVTLPLSRTALVSAWLFTFIMATQELSAPLLLVNIKTVLIPTIVFQLYEVGRYGEVATLGVVMSLITTLSAIVAVAVAGAGVRKWTGK